MERCCATGAEVTGRRPAVVAGRGERLGDRGVAADRAAHPARLDLGVKRLAVLEPAFEAMARGATEIEQNHRPTSVRSIPGAGSEQPVEIARVVGGSLRSQATLRGLVTGTYSRVRSHSAVRQIAIAISTAGFLGPAGELGKAIASGSLSGILTAGFGTLLTVAGLMVVLGLPIWKLVRPPATVAVYDITAITVDGTECELAVEHGADGDTETTTLDVYNDEELAEAVSILRLKGAPVEV